MDNRLFHRFEANHLVTFELGNSRVQGRIANVSAGGAFVEADILPEIGGHLELAVQAEDGRSYLWLDILVVRVHDAPKGFGGYLIQALSHKDERHLHEQLRTIFGITKAVVRSVQPPGGAEEVHVYRFQHIDPEDDEVDWLQYDAGTHRSATRKQSAGEVGQKGQVPRSLGPQSSLQIHEESPLAAPAAPSGLEVHVSVSFGGMELIGRLTALDRMNLTVKCNTQPPPLWSDLIIGIGEVKVDTQLIHSKHLNGVNHFYLQVNQVIEADGENAFDALADRFRGIK